MAVVEKVRRGFNVHLRIAFEDFDDEVRSFRQSLLEAPNPDSTLKLRLVNKALVFSVALRMYEEHVRSAVSRHWGKNSEEVRFCGEAFSEVFDQSFAYRVVHALRNALVHSDAELVTVRFATYLTDPDAADSGSASEVVVGLSRDRFAQTDVRAATRREVSALDSDPDLLDLSREALLAVETLDVKLEHVLHPEVDRATALLWALAKDHFPDTAQAPVFMEVNREVTPVGYLSVPPIIWDYIVRRGAHALAAQP
ncbi:hypothetical protein PFZ49_01980 [Microbacterium lacticum]|uniref:hypothetical protein n=1 Tax=Microbacterium lacticum TaxID=33885 RepID=UPI003A86F2D7